VLVESSPGEVIVHFADPLLVRHGILERRRWHVIAISQDNVALDWGEPISQLLKKWQERQIGHHHAVLRVIDDPCDLVGKETWVDRMIDRSEAQNAVPGFEVAPAVPGQRRDSVAELDAVLLKALGDLQRALPYFRISRRMERAFERARDNAAVAMVRRS